MQKFLISNLKISVISIVLFSVLFILTNANFYASEITESATATNPLHEKRLQNLSAEFRCLVCQNQTIADSDADLAVDLRKEIRTMIADGKTDEQIIDFMTERYGDFVLYRPPFKAQTALLWLLPAAFFAIGVIIFFNFVTKNKRGSQQNSNENSNNISENKLSAEELQQAKDLLK